MSDTHLDFETFSMAPLKKTGAWRYSVDPTTQILYACWAVDDDEVSTWCPIITPKEAARFDFPEDWYYGPTIPRPLRLALGRGNRILAHNAPFERGIIQNVMRTRHDGPDTDIRQYRCTAARAAAAGLPRSLEHAAMALGVANQKDKEGSKLLGYFVKPKKPTRKDPRTRIMPLDMKDEFIRVGEYCQQDVRTERDIDYRIPSLDPNERRLFTFDLQINERGIGIDTALARDTSEVVGALEAEIVARVQQLTKSEEYPEGLRPTQRDKMLKFFDSIGVVLENMQADYIKKFIKDNIATMDPLARELLQLRMEAGKSSTKKLASMLAFADPADDRARGTLLFYGAHTGRWSGKGVQPHNFIRGHLKYEEQLRIFELLRQRDAEIMQILYERPITAISSCMRGFIIPRKGHILRVVDYSAIEARVLAWLALDDEILDAYRAGYDVYKVMASKLFNVPYDNVTDEQRRIGKNLILGCGYGLGAAKFVTYCEKAGAEIGLDFAKQAVRTYRNERHKIVRFWSDVERAAIAAVREGRRYDRAILLRNLKFYLKDFEGETWFCIELPSGRSLHYYRPKVKIVEKWGEPAHQLTFKVEFRGRLVSESTYGGKLVENIVQAVARDFLVHGMYQAEQEGYPVIGTVHDELLTEPTIEHGSVKELEEIVSRLPPWGDGCPISAEGFESYRYRKG